MANYDELGTGAGLLHINGGQLSGLVVREYAAIKEEIEAQREEHRQRAAIKAAARRALEETMRHSVADAREESQEGVGPSSDRPSSSKKRYTPPPPAEKCDRCKKHDVDCVIPYTRTACDGCRTARVSCSRALKPTKPRAKRRRAVTTNPSEVPGPSTSPGEELHNHREPSSSSAHIDMTIDESLDSPFDAVDADARFDGQLETSFAEYLSTKLDEQRKTFGEQTALLEARWNAKYEALLLSHRDLELKVAKLTKDSRHIDTELMKQYQENSEHIDSYQRKNNAILLKMRHGCDELMSDEVPKEME